MLKIFKIIILVCSFNVLTAQNYFLPLQQTITNDFSKQLQKNNKTVHTSSLPFSIEYLKKTLDTNELFQDSPSRNKILNKIFYNDLVTVNDKELTFNLNLLFDLEKNKVKADTNQYWQNTRGFEIYGTLGKKIGYYTEFFENQAYFVPYINDFINKNFVVPGQAGWKVFGKDKNGKDFNYASAYLNYSPINNLTLTFGHTKNFFGDGYRSVLLSDNAPPYLQLKLKYTKNKWQYTAIFAELQNFKSKYYFYHYTKHLTLNYLSFSPFPNIELSLFEAIIWKTSDDSTYVKKFSPLFLINLPFVRLPFIGLDSKNNAMIGLNVRYNPLKNIVLYSQFLLDDYGKASYQKRYAYQFGIKNYDLFFDRIKNTSIFIQVEYNNIRPYTYTSEYPYSSYTNMNQSMASATGTGNREIIGIIRLNHRRLHIEAKFNNILKSQDTTASNFGSNIMLSTSTADFSATTNIIGQGNPAKISILTTTFYFTLNTKTKLSIFAQLTQRKFKDNFTEKDLFFISFGIKNYLRNIYYDF